MKRSVFFILIPMFSFGNYTFTCLCSSFLSNIYNTVDSSLLEENLDKFNENLDPVKKTLDDNIEVVEEDIKKIEELNKTLKVEIAQLTEYKSNLIKTKSIIFQRE